MTVFRQENLEEHYETGEDLGRWVRADGAVASERGGARGEGRLTPALPLHRVLGAQREKGIRI